MFGVGKLLKVPTAPGPAMPAQATVRISGRQVPTAVWVSVPLCLGVTVSEKCARRAVPMYVLLRAPRVHGCLSYSSIV